MNYPDRYAGTPYRNITNAAEAVELAQFYNVRRDNARKAAGLAVEQIDIAIANLQAARNQITEQENQS